MTISIIALAAIAFTSGAHAESTGRNQWFCQEEYACIENGRGKGQVLYPSKIGGGATEAAARAKMRMAPGYNCKPGSLKKTSPTICKIVPVETM